MVYTLTGSIESLFFEYKKREALLKHRVGIELFHNSRWAPSNIVQDYVNSRLLIDLFSVVDKAIDERFTFYKYKLEKKKSKLAILIDKGKLYNAPYLLWYKEWRNDAAHKFGTIQSYLLRQASDDMRHQLLEWELISDEFETTYYEMKIDDSTYHYGSIIKNIPILLYRITYQENGYNYETLTNLSVEEYFDKKRKEELIHGN